MSGERELPTPLPWSAGYESSDFSPRAVLGPPDKYGLPVFVAVGLSDADAELIVRAVNAHAELVDALEAGLRPDALNCGFGGQADDPDICCCGKPKAYHWKAAARTALAKAKGA